MGAARPFCSADTAQDWLSIGWSPLWHNRNKKNARWTQQSRHLLAAAALGKCLYPSIISQITNMRSLRYRVHNLDRWATGNSNVVWCGLSTIFLHSLHLENTKSCHQPTVFVAARWWMWNRTAAISWESLAPVIALHGCRGNVKPYYTSNRYYYHANTVSSQYLHIQSIPCVHLWRPPCSPQFITARLL